MNAQSVLNHLAANVREELAAKRAALALIEAQEGAVARCDMDAFEAGLERMRVHLEGDRRREQKRQRLIEQLAAAWQVAPGTLTLGSIAIRFGAQGDELRGLRGELRQVVADVARRNRRLSALLGMHRRLNRDVLKVVLGAEGGAEPTQAGSLVDARA
ncbi:MAG: flagellar export chaperone FlgN [Planctomycetes bacterium]|nr:flagellar export chaperone FlgN [Planctomycetota bacterium]